MRLVWRVLGCIVAVVVVLGALGLGYRAWRQHENAQSLAIRTPNGIEEAGFVRIGGVDQWVQIRGEDRNNPVILFLHGGPGGSVTPLSAIFHNWEKHFTVVLWDQRGAGKTYGRNGGPGEGEMTIDRVADDGIEVAEYLRRHLHKDKVIALGHSWGTMIGVVMMQKRPDLFAAYVGTGQVAAIAEKEKYLYAATLKTLQEHHDAEGVEALKRIGAPPYPSYHELLIERDLSERYTLPAEKNIYDDMTPVVLFAPGWSLWDIYDFLQAHKHAAGANYKEHLTYDARSYGLNFKMPFFVFNGDQDVVTPTALAKPYFDEITAPQKTFVVLRNAGHSAVLTEPDVFLHELEARVRPLATNTQ